jgi:hypothetical protein
MITIFIDQIKCHLHYKRYFLTSFHFFLIKNYLLIK